MTSPKSFGRVSCARRGAVRPLAILAASGVLVAGLAACGSEGGAASTSLANGGVTLDNEHELKLLSQLDFAILTLLALFWPMTKRLVMIGGESIFSTWT